MNVSSATVDNCNFLEGSTGLMAGFGGPVLVRNCLFDGQSNVAVSPEVASNISIEKCTFRNLARVLYSGTGDNRVSMIDSVIEGVSDCTVLMAHFGSLVVTNCTLAVGARGVVYVQDTPSCIAPKHLDMAGNYWGTSDPDSISMLIRDRNDSDQACYFIDYEPFLRGSTPTEKRSLGGVKLMFR
jgi:hypothetical protein